VVFGGSTVKKNIMGWMDFEGRAEGFKKSRKRRPVPLLLGRDDDAVAVSVADGALRDEREGFIFGGR